MEADQYLVVEQGKYDMDGPKNLYDAKMLTDWYIKIVTEHPLVSYIEDGIRIGDNAGWQLHCAALKEKGISTGVNSWFKSELDVIKEHTQIVVLEEEEAPEAISGDDVLSQEQKVASDGGPTSPKSEIVDPNALKFVPSCVHL